MELAFAFFLGCFLGVVTGIIPGFNIFVAVLLFFPVIINWDPVSIMFMYITLASVNQYFGSVSATIFAIPGSTTSIPALVEGHALFKNGQGDLAIMYAAIGSFFASMFAVLLIVFCLPFVDVFYNLFNTHVQVVVVVVAAVTFIFFSQNNFLISFVLFATGNVLAFVGWNDQYRMSFGTFGIDALHNGIPLLPVMIALFVFPIFLRNSKTNTKLQFIPITITGYVSAVKNIWPLRWTLVRSGLIGSLAGFVPGASFALSTIIAYNYEKILQIRKGKYKKNKGNLETLVAAETANNAGVYTSMIPMLFLAIPITASSGLIYSLMSLKGVALTADFFQEFYGVVTYGFIFSSVFGLLAAGKYVNFLKFLNGVNTRWFYITIFSALIVVCYFANSAQYFGTESLMILFALLPLGFVLRNFDTMPLVFGFILHDLLISSIIRITYFY